MKAKELANVVVNRSVKFLKENGKNIAVTVLAEALDVPITTSRNVYSCKSANMRTSQPYIYPRNAKEAAIESMYNSAKSMMFDSDKEEVAGKIFKIALTGDDSTMIYGIKLLERIQSTMLFDSNKKSIATMISKLAETTAEVSE